HYGARGRPVPGAGALEQQPAGKIAFHHDRIGRSIDGRQRMFERNQTRLDPLEQPAILTVGEPDQTDDVPERGRLGDVGRPDTGYAGDLHRVEIDPDAECERSQNRQLVGRVDTFDVEAWIGFGIAELLRLLEHLGEIAARLLHGRKDVVAGAVENPVDSRNRIGRDTFSQAADYRYPTCHRSLELE